MRAATVGGINDILADNGQSRLDGIRVACLFLSTGFSDCAESYGQHRGRSESGENIKMLQEGVEHSC